MKFNSDDIFMICLLAVCTVLLIFLVGFGLSIICESIYGT